MMRKKIGRLFSLSTFVLGYTLAVFIWFVLWLTVSDANWILVLANRAVVYVFFLIPLLLIFSFSSAKTSVVSYHSRLDFFLALSSISRTQNSNEYVRFQHPPRHDI